MKRLFLIGMLILSSCGERDALIRKAKKDLSELQDSISKVMEFAINSDILGKINATVHSEDIAKVVSQEEFKDIQFSLKKCNKVLSLDIRNLISDLETSKDNKNGLGLSGSGAILRNNITSKNKIIGHLKDTLTIIEKIYERIEKSNTQDKNHKLLKSLILLGKLIISCKSILIKSDDKTIIKKDLELLVYKISLYELEYLHKNGYSGNESLKNIFEPREAKEGKISILGDLLIRGNAKLREGNIEDLSLFRKDEVLPLLNKIVNIEKEDFIKENKYSWITIHKVIRDTGSFLNNPDSKAVKKLESFISTELILNQLEINEYDIKKIIDEFYKKYFGELGEKYSFRSIEETGKIRSKSIYSEKQNLIKIFKRVVEDEDFRKNIDSVIKDMDPESKEIVFVFLYSLKVRAKSLLKNLEEIK